MPPFRAGLLKRKIDTKSRTGESQKSENESGSGEEDALLPGELDLEEGYTDSETDEQDAVDSDHEQDEVLYGDDADSTLGEDENAEQASDDSSEIDDSEADDDSDEDGSSEEGNSEADESDKGKQISDEEQSEAESGIGQTHSSETESGIGQTHSSGSDSDKKTDNKQKQKVKKMKKTKEVTSRSTTEDTTTIDRLADSINSASVARPVAQKDEYESGDTSDEEERVNTVGDIPMWWYNEYPHVGYDLDGRKIMKPPQRDQIDEFLKKCEDPDFWRTVRDPATGQDVVLSKEDLELIHRLRTGQLPDPAHDEYKPWIEWFSSFPLATPLRAFPEHKRSFLPSRGEQRQVARLVHALRMGWLKTRKQLALERKQSKEKKFYNLWGSAGAAEEEPRPRGLQRHIPAPRRPLPAHAESYNPPPEYLLDAKEMKEWSRLRETPWRRKYTFLPRRHAALRAVPAYERLVRERFLRCLDLYLAPRAIKMRLTITAEELVPKLPSPRELQPFPTSEALVFRGHVGLVRTAGFDPSGQYVVSGGDDGTLRVWESSSGRCLRSLALGAGVASAAWTPAGGLSLVAAAAGARLLLLNPGADIGAHRLAARTDLLLQEPPPPSDVTMDERTSSAVRWDPVSAEEWARGVRLAVTHFKPLVHVAWHARGDYVCCTVREGQARSVLVHQVSRRRSQLPFSRSKGLVQCALFHPTKPTLFVATQRAIRVYDLVKQELVRKLCPGAQWVSCMAVHPGGDNLLVGSYDRKLAWFDLELSAKPYRTLRLHGQAVRSVAFHPRYPLFASAGDDKYLVVSHGMVYNDLLQNPLLVPLKQLGGGLRREELCTLALAWHPHQPWLLAAGADSLLRLYS